MHPVEEYTEHKKKRKEILKKMQDIVGVEYATSDAEIGIAYSYDMLAGVDYLGRGKLYFMPDYVVLPETTEQLQKLILLANEYLIPVYFCSQRTNIGGLANPEEGGVVVDVHRMNRIIEVNEEMMTMTVEPGVCYGEAMKAAAEHDLYLPGILGPFGGSLVGSYMCANMGHYGEFGFTDRAVSLEIVLGTGEIIRTGGAAMLGQEESGKYFRCALGSQPMELFRQSQGSLGCVTKLTHRLLPMPEAEELMMIGFDNLEDLVSFVKKVERRRITTSMAVENREVLEIYMLMACPQ